MRKSVQKKRSKAQRLDSKHNQKATERSDMHGKARRRNRHRYGRLRK